MFLKPFTKKLREEFLTSYNIKFKNCWEYGKHLYVPALNCNIFNLIFPSFIVTLSDNPSQQEGKINLNFLEKLYVWAAIRDKILEMKMIGEFNENSL